MLPSVPHVVDVTHVRGARADGPPSLLLEVPHGATATRDFTSVRDALRGELPAGLADFFHVNTDVGAPEIAEAIAARFVADRPTASALVVRARIPRTFIDVNRVLDLSAADYKSGGVTPGLPPYVRDADDVALLRARYAAYQEVAEQAFAAVCGAGGLAIMVHTYAPRSVDVEVDADIGPKLRAAYAPEVEPTWPLRPEVDLIVRTQDGRVLADARLVDAVRARLADMGVTAATSETYPLHPSTTAYARAVRYAGRTLCLEVRRDLVADPWDPFVEMRMSGERVARVAGALADALREA
ncbi:MAG: N-formylglutamate amidohydrolase [Myxococcota bacterium]